MPLKFQEVKAKIVSVKASGKLTDEDYDEFVPWMEKLIERYGRLRMLFEMEDFRGWDAHGAWDEFKFEYKHKKDLKRVAVVGDKKWEEWASALSGFFTSSDVRYFDRNQMDEAWDWLKSGYYG